MTQNQPIETTQHAIEVETKEKTHFLWLEITGKCQRECEDCYAESGPKGTHGTMTEVDWKYMLEEAPRLGIRVVQFIGGEPTLHPSLPELIQYALSQGLQVEVFSNMEHIKPHLWDVLSQPSVSMATSYYSADNGEHDSIVRRRGSYARTKANIAEAIRRTIPLPVGVDRGAWGAGRQRRCTRTAKLRRGCAADRSGLPEASWSWHSQSNSLYGAALWQVCQWCLGHHA